MSLLETIQSNIEVIKKNLDTLPLNTDEDKAKYNKYLDELLDNYNHNIGIVEKEMKKRYSLINDIKPNEQIEQTDNKIKQYNTDYLLDTYKEPLE